MILGHGIDITDLGRVRILLTNLEEDFLHSTFTATERETENLPEDRVPFFAGRLAAKEAVVKALGTGFTGDIAMRQVEIARLPDGSPEVRLRGAAKKAAESLGVGRWLVSISHTETIAIACVFAEGMGTGFWSDKTIKARGQELIDPYRAERVKHGAYELSVGSEAYITSDKGKKTKIAPDTPITIPPGQFGLLITREVVRVPHKAIAFISIRAGTKFRGLVNVSGFHVDPGYNDRLIFSVYNAGSQNIVLDFDQPVFLIWYADLHEDTEIPYPPRKGDPRGISAEDITKIQGDVASPAELKTQMESLKTDFDKRLHKLETESEKRLHKLETEAEQRLHKLETNTDKRVHTVETRQVVVQTVLVAVVVGLLMTIGGAVVKYLYERPTEKQGTPTPTQVRDEPPPPMPKAKD